ncbi:hypothetical protein R1sor_003056 [Riccia sorocarpa]|uniref:Amidohydrolase-related domain-containing protein n=1 Tax=Riccia sorocarpa TaxID=122646 RepID=A0ABD3H3A4_9MARC
MGVQDGANMGLQEGDYDAMAASEDVEHTLQICTQLQLRSVSRYKVQPPVPLALSPGPAAGNMYTIRYILGAALIIILAVVWNYITTSSSVHTFSRELELKNIAATRTTVQRIDTHAHFLPPFYYDTLKRMGLDKEGPLNSMPKWNAKDHLAFMDKLGIETAILSISSPGARLPCHTLQEARTLAREVNNYGHMMAVTNPGRLQFFASHVLPDEGSVDEAIRALDTLEAAGVALLANSEGWYLGRPEFDPLMEVLNSRGATIFVHPHSLPGTLNLEVPPFVVDFLLDTTRAAATLVMNNVTARFPNLQWILGHSGGFMPFAGYRIGSALSLVTGESAESFLQELRRFYVDTAVSSSPSALPSTIAFLTTEHLTFGSDYHFAPNMVIERETGQLDTFLKLELDSWHQINHRNAARVFGSRLNQRKEAPLN